MDAGCSRNMQRSKHDASQQSMWGVVGQQVFLRRYDHLLHDPGYTSYVLAQDLMSLVMCRADGGLAVGVHRD